MTYQELIAILGAALFAAGAVAFSEWRRARARRRFVERLERAR